MSLNKSWGDRADRDLFLSILMVKSVGVISGQEWASIGALMREQGHGFTNEGCRQHFQGLRRKSTTKKDRAKPAEGTRDPSHNPITRRPGPGRSRGRKRDHEGAPSTSNVQIAPAPQQSQQQDQQHSMMMTSSPLMSSHIHGPHSTLMMSHVQQQQQQQQQQHHALFQPYAMHGNNMDISAEIPVDPAVAASLTPSPSAQLASVDVSTDMNATPPTDPALVAAAPADLNDEISAEADAVANMVHAAAAAAAAASSSQPSSALSPEGPLSNNQNTTSITTPSNGATPLLSDGMGAEHHGHHHHQVLGQRHAMSDGQNGQRQIKRQRLSQHHGLAQDMMAGHLQTDVGDVGVVVDGQEQHQHHGGISTDDDDAAAVLALQQASNAAAVEQFESAFTL